MQVLDHLDFKGQMVNLEHKEGEVRTILLCYLPLHSRGWILVVGVKGNSCQLIHLSELLYIC